MLAARIIASLTFLTAIILSVPLAFDVGGRASGLAFSLSLCFFYFIDSILRLYTPHKGSRYRRLAAWLLSGLQWIVLPSLLIWSLNRFSIDPPRKTPWAGRSWNHVGSQSSSTFLQQIFAPDGLAERTTIGAWDTLLCWSSPVFQIVEGFCSLLVIQAAGQITRWLVNKTDRGDTWMIGLLILSASTISSSVYFLWRVFQFPIVGHLDATLIGIAISCTIILCAWGIGSGKGNPVESSLLFAYIVLCLYQMFTDYQPSNPLENYSNTVASPPAHAKEFPPVPPAVMESYSTIISVLSSLPGVIHAIFTFFVAALCTITPSVIISLAYRLFVLYASTRIIPAIRESSMHALMPSSAPDDDSEASGRFASLLGWFNPSILIAVYTSLLMQHFASTSADDSIVQDWWTRQGYEMGGNLWRWINVATTLGMYALELWLGKEDLDAGITTHWKAD